MLFGGYIVFFNHDNLLILCTVELYSHELESNDPLVYKILRIFHHHVSLTIIRVDLFWLKLVKREQTFRIESYSVRACRVDTQLELEYIFENGCDCRVNQCVGTLHTLTWSSGLILEWSFNSYVVQLLNWSILVLAL